MHIHASINDYTRKDFFEEVFTKFPTLERTILDDFIRYKSTGELPNYFGTDVAYTQPHVVYKAGVMHIHLCLPPNTFQSNRPQADRKCKMGDPDNDACLVYVQGDLYENRYSLLAIMYPDAHSKGRQVDVMSYLGRIAQQFKDNN